MSDRDTGDTVPKRLKYWANRQPAKHAYVFVDGANSLMPLSRHHLNDLAERFAARLKRLGVKPGSMVCNTLPNCRARLITDLGAIVAGCAALNGQVLLSSGNDFLRSLKAAKCKYIIMPTIGPANDILRNFCSQIEPETHESKCWSWMRVSCESAPCLEHILAISANSHEDQNEFVQELMCERVWDTPVAVTRDHEAYVFTTSGSTGYSKLIPRTNDELLLLARQLADSLEVDDICYNDRPLGWLGGFPFLYLVKGITIYLQEQLSGQQMRPCLQLWPTLIEARITAAVILSTDIERLQQEYTQGKFQHMLRIVLTGGQTIQNKRFQIVGLYTQRLVSLYGSTEIGFVANGHIHAGNKDSVKSAFVGKHLEQYGTEMRIVDQNMKAVKGPGVCGQLHFRGSPCVRHYLSPDESASKAFLEGGWFDTGDLGYTDENGDLYVIGRATDSIMHGVFLVYPQWLENHMQACPGVLTVAVIGVPHPIKCQELCACVIRDVDSTLTEEGLRKHCETLFASKIDDEFKHVPEHFLFFETFPTLSTGKVSRQSLQKVAMERLGIKENS